MSIDLTRSKLSLLTLVGPTRNEPDSHPEYKRVWLPGNSTVRVNGGLVRIPLGEERMVYSPDLTYELMPPEAS